MRELAGVVREAGLGGRSEALDQPGVVAQSAP